MWNINSHVNSISLSIFSLIYMYNRCDSKTFHATLTLLQKKMADWIYSFSPPKCLGACMYRDIYIYNITAALHYANNNNTSHTWLWFWTKMYNVRLGYVPSSCRWVTLSWELCFHARFRCFLMLLFFFSRKNAHNIGCICSILAALWLIQYFELLKNFHRR